METDGFGRFDYIRAAAKAARTPLGDAEHGGDSLAHALALRDVLGHDVAEVLRGHAGCAF